jgi:hypothetical protein
MWLRCFISKPWLYQRFFFQFYTNNFLFILTSKLPGTIVLSILLWCRFSWNHTDIIVRIFFVMSRKVLLPFSILVVIVITVNLDKFALLISIYPPTISTMNTKSCKICNPPPLFQSRNGCKSCKTNTFDPTARIIIKIHSTRLPLPNSTCYTLTLKLWPCY